MVDPAIEAYINEKKETWLKNKITQTMNEEEAENKRQEGEEKFSLENWLPDAAKRASQISFASHPCTFSHPSARKNKNSYVTSVIEKSIKAPDGYLRSGNVQVEIDALGNAAALDVYKFLTLKMQDDRKLIDHIEQGSHLAVALLTIQSENYETLRTNFLKIKNTSNNGNTITSSKIKQVFFPVESDYHLLSLLSNSGIIFDLKKRINSIRFSEENKQAREKKRNNVFHEKSFPELYDLYVVGFGGTKPQNVSVFNYENGGRAYLLKSLPPKILQRNIRFPKKNFFMETVRFYHYRSIFEALHKLFQADYNNTRIRTARDFHIQELIDRIIAAMWAVRSIPFNNYRPELSNLKKHQKIWLCPEFQESRESEEHWLGDLCNEISSWIVIAYEKELGKKAIKLGEAERKHIHSLVVNNKEALR
ncbi:MAG: type I-F CRISPR-associated protein Csy1 [Candidatus Cloacimonetes bacterium]|nr:type I-F CRISPR-associated protein Csy1 [Candidatus Cloacimonadota bacterium]